MISEKNLVLSRLIKPNLSLSKLTAEDIAVLKIIDKATGGGVVPVYDADIINGIATFDGVTRSKPLVSLLLNIPISQTGSGTPSPTNVRDFVGVSGVNISRTGKNLLNNPDNTITGGSYVINNVNVPMAVGYYVLSFEFSGTNNSSSLRVDNENGTAIFTTSKTVINGHNEFLINLPSNGSFVKLYSNAVGTYSNFQIELGNQFTTYEPYNGNTYTFTFGQTVYSAILDVLTGKLTVTHEFITFDGSNDEQWGQGGSIGDNRRYAITLEKSYVNRENSTSNYLTYSAGNKGEWGTFSLAQDVNFIVKDKDGYFSSISDFITYLQSNPLQLVYELAEPIEIQLTPTIINTLIGENVIFADVADVTECKYTRK